MLRKLKISNRLGLALAGSMLLLFGLLFSISSTNQTWRFVRQTIRQVYEPPSSQIVHHGMGYSTTRSSGAESIAELAASTPLTSELSIRPLTDIYVDGPPRLVNITTTYATLLFTSSIPVNCSVVYGPNTDFGQIAQDANMSGGAITDHRPLLTGLLPGTEYLYRVQGTDASGTIYVSDVATFTTPVESTQVADEINVAALDDGAAITDVSSNFGGATNEQTWGANSAIDGNPATAWSSSGDGNDAFIEITLAEPSIVTAVDVWTRFMADGSAQIFQFTVTTNPGDAGSAVFGPFTLPDKDQGYRFAIDNSSVVESIRLDVVESSGGNTGLVEFQVFASVTVTATDTTGSALYLPIAVQ